MSDENTTTLIVSVAGAIAIFLLSFYLGMQKGRGDIISQAVKLNKGEWVIQSNGKPEFRFKQ